MRDVRAGGMRERDRHWNSSHRDCGGSRRRADDFRAFDELPNDRDRHFSRDRHRRYSVDRRSRGPRYRSLSREPDHHRVDLREDNRRADLRSHHREGGGIDDDRHGGHLQATTTVNQRNHRRGSRAERDLTPTPDQMHRPGRRRLSSGRVDSVDGGHRDVGLERYRDHIQGRRHDSGGPPADATGSSFHGSSSTKGRQRQQQRYYQKHSNSRTPNSPFRRVTGDRRGRQLSPPLDGCGYHRVDHMSTTQGRRTKSTSGSPSGSRGDCGHRKSSESVGPHDATMDTPPGAPAPRLPPPPPSTAAAAAATSSQPTVPRLTPHQNSEVRLKSEKVKPEMRPIGIGRSSTNNDRWMPKKEEKMKVDELKLQIKKSGGWPDEPKWGTGQECTRGVNADAELEEGEAPMEKELPNFRTTGLLAEDTNLVNGVLLKYSTPTEGRLPMTRWRLYMFKGTEQTKVLHLHRKQFFMIGKDQRVVDILLLHPTVSKQHAVLQYRLTPSGEILPYIIDLESTNGTFVNGDKIDASRYFELRDKDVLRFGRSSRELVLVRVDSQVAS